LAVLALRPLAIAINLIDRPGGRKLHEGNVPVVGGVGMLLGIVLGLGLLSLPGQSSSVLLAACALLTTVGLIDDRFDLSPWARLLVQVSAALLLIYGTGTSVATLGAPFGQPILLDGVASHLVTVILMVAAINAFNMLDGMDGLAGALAIVALAAIAVIAAQNGNAVALSISVVIISAVAAFLISNLPFAFNRNVRCFMGDSGSTLLGLCVAWLCIDVSQNSGPGVQPVTVLWIVALPLFELCWTVMRRSARGIPPFRSDFGHMHHVVQRAGFGVQGTFFLFVVFATVLAAIGIGLDRADVSDAWSFTLLVLAGALVVRLFFRPQILWRFVPRAFHKAPHAVTD
jgi:UDP-GlcNAc:undecaprenyl-phosphate GlcNAc-1-phosphate transferase